MAVNDEKSQLPDLLFVPRDPSRATEEFRYESARQTLHNIAKKIPTLLDLRKFTPEIPQPFGNFFVAFMGSTKGGKSSTINALLGAPVVPTGPTKTTCRVTEIRAGSVPQRQFVIVDEMRGANAEETAPATFEGTIPLEAVVLRNAETDNKVVKVTIPNSEMQMFGVADVPSEMNAEIMKYIQKVPYLCFQSSCL